jgi:hypothetical protein
MGLSASKSPRRVFKRTEARRKQLEKELPSFKKMFAGINRVLRVAQPQEMGYALAYKQLFSRRRNYAEIFETICEHREEEFADLMDDPMTQDEAERTAHREFSNVSRIDPIKALREQ